jgi:ADP-ribose pyrophosphatase YjhB (NUDIX family)
LLLPLLFVLFHCQFINRFTPFGTLTYLLHNSFVEVGETPVDAVLRECEEETGITIPKHLAQAHGHVKSTDQTHSAMRLIGVYSDPRRDARRSNVSTAYALLFDSNQMATKDGTGIPKAGDDAKEVVSIPIEDIGTKYKGDDWFADHLTILLDFKEQLLQEEGYMDRNGLGELADDVKRSTCS